jgi:hypothetical protein
MAVSSIYSDENMNFSPSRTYAQLWKRQFPSLATHFTRKLKAIFNKLLFLVFWDVMLYGWVHGP